MQMENNFRHGLAVSGTTIGFTLPFVGLGIFLISYGMPMGILAVLAWAIFILRFEGVVIDFKKKELQLYTTFLGFKLGGWRPAKEFAYYRFKNTSKTTNLSSRGGQTSYSSDEAGLFMYDKRNKEDVLIAKGSKAENNILAKELELKLGIFLKPKK